MKEVERIVHVGEPGGIVDQRAVHPRSSDCHYNQKGSQEHLCYRKAEAISYFIPQLRKERTLANRSDIRSEIVFNGQLR